MSGKRVRAAHTRVRDDIVPVIIEISRWRLRQQIRVYADVFCAAAWVGAGLMVGAWLVAEAVLSRYGVWVWWGGTAIVLTLIGVIGALIVTWLRAAVTAWANEENQ